MNTKHGILERLGRQSEDSRLWAEIAKVLDDWEELQGLLWLKEQVKDYGNSEAAERLHELERRFGIK